MTSGLHQRRKIPHSFPLCFLLFSEFQALLAHAKPQFFVPRPLPQATTVPKKECIYCVDIRNCVILRYSYTSHHPLLSLFVPALIASVKTALRKKQQIDMRYFTRCRSSCSCPHNVSGGNQMAFYEQIICVLRDIVFYVVIKALLFQGFFLFAIF